MSNMNIKCIRYKSQNFDHLVIQFIYQMKYSDIPNGLYCYIYNLTAKEMFLKKPFHLNQLKLRVAN